MSASTYTCLFCEAILGDSKEGATKYTNMGIPKIVQSSAERGDRWWKR